MGRGAVLLGDEVALGYRMASAGKRPILLQPREPNAVIRIGKGTAIMNGSEFIARLSISVGE